MIAWILVGVLGTACAFLAAFFRREMLLNDAIERAYQEQIARLTADRDRMLATALESRGIQIVSAQEPPRQAIAPPPSPFSQVAAKVRALEQRYAKEAEELRGKADA